MSCTNPFIAALLFASLCAPSALAQTEPPPTPSTHFSFDVVSIRPSAKDTIQYLRVLPDGYEAKGMSLVSTIALAYFPAPYFRHQDELKGIPEWANSQRFDIEARVDPSQSAEWQGLHEGILKTPTVLQGMVREMLADRCKLVIHSSPSQADGYLLTLNGHALKLTPQSPDTPLPNSAMKLPDGGRAVGVHKDDTWEWTFYNTSMNDFVTFLSASASRPVEDKTGLEGKYQFTVSTFASPTNQPGSDTDPDQPTHFDIGRVGLTLRKTKIPGLIWTIDHIEQPSPN